MCVSIPPPVVLTFFRPVVRQAQSTFEEKCVQLDRICDERAAMQQDLSTKLCKIDELEVELAGLQELQKATANGLAEMKKRELARFVDFFYSFALIDHCTFWT